MSCCNSCCDPCRSTKRTVYYYTPSSCNPCYTPTPCPCPVPTPTSNVVYITNVATPTTVPSGGTAIPIGTIIPAGNTTVPAGTVSVINGYTGAPTTNIGGIIANNGFFTVPVSGTYNINANVTFAVPLAVTAGDLREVYIYKVSGATGIVTAIADETAYPISGSTTSINISANEEFLAGDRFFIAARQITSGGAAIDTVATVGRLAVVRYYRQC
jgi:hypothetical protein